MDLRALGQSTFLKGLAGGVVGVLLLLGLLHGWTDHLLIHQAVTVLNQQLQQYPLRAAPGVPPGAPVVPPIAPVAPVPTTP